MELRHHHVHSKFIGIYIYIYMFLKDNVEVAHCCNTKNKSSWTHSKPTRAISSPIGPNRGKGGGGRGVTLFIG